MYDKYENPDNDDFTKIEGSLILTIFLAVVCFLITGIFISLN